MSENVIKGHIPPIRSGIPPIGAKFLVSEDNTNSNINSETIGFMMLVQKLDEYYQNVAQISVVTVHKPRKDKQARLDTTELTVPIFVDNSFTTEVFNKIMPDPSNKRNYVKIVPAPDFHLKHILSLDVLDFIGWAAANVNRLHQMNGIAKHGMWPEDMSHPLNIINRMLGHFNEDRAQEYIEKFSSTITRERILNEIRTKDSSMSKIMNSLLLKKVQIEAHASKFLVFTNEGEFRSKEDEEKPNEFRFTEESQLLKENKKFYVSLYERLRGR